MPTNSGALLAVGQADEINHTPYTSAFVDVFSAVDGSTEVIRAYANGVIQSTSLASDGDLFVSGNYIMPTPYGVPPTMMDLGGGTFALIRRPGCLCRRSAPARHRALTPTSMTAMPHDLVSRDHGRGETRHGHANQAGRREPRVAHRRDRFSSLRGAVGGPIATAEARGCATLSVAAQLDGPNVARLAGAWGSLWMSIVYKP